MGFQRKFHIKSMFLGNEEKREAGGQGKFVADFNIFSY
jgi:hypothetical protein